MIKIGQVLMGRYRVDAFIASGSMGAVYKVWDFQRETALAMKVLHAEMADDPAIIRGFKREINALRNLRHPNIVPFYGVEQNDDAAFMLQAFVNGPSLKQVLEKRRGQAFSLPDTLTYIKALCSSLGFAHFQGIVHCDVKPGNVLIDQGGNIYLTDFGIARHMDSTLTSTLAGAGTPRYMAPEQIKETQVSPATDIYALGVMTFEMLVGQPPFTGNEPGIKDPSVTLGARVKAAHVNLPAPNPRSINPNISTAVAEVILRAVEKQPDRRYASTQEYFTALSQAAGCLPSQVSDRIGLLTAEIYNPPAAPVTLGGGITTPPTYPQPAPQPQFGMPDTDNAPPPIPAPMPWWRSPVVAVFGIAIVAMMVFFLLKGNGNPPFLMLTPSPTAATAISPFTVTQPEKAKPVPPTETSAQSAAINTPVPPTVIPTDPPLPAATMPPPYKWQKQKVNDKEVAFASLTITKGGTPYIIYMTQGNVVHKYELATWDNNNWQPVLMPNASDKIYSGWTDIGESRDGLLYISYFDNDNKLISYVYMNAAKRWETSYSVINNVNPSSTSIDFDAQNRPVIAFLDNNDGYVKFAVLTVHGWELNLVERAATDRGLAKDGRGVAMFADALGGIHLAYFADSEGLRYAYVKTGQPSIVTVDPERGVGVYPSLAIDSFGGLYISYYDSRQGALKLATRRDSTWTTAVIDDTGDVGQFTSLAVDSQRVAHISYYDVDNQSLKYIRVYGSQIDKPVTVDGTGSGQWSSLVLDITGTPRISYVDSANNDLKYAWAKP